MKILSKIITATLICAGLLNTAQAADPSTQATNTTITNRTDDALSVTWTRGNGEYCLVVVKPFSNSYAYPVDGLNSIYSASSVYGGGSHLGSSNYVVYKGTGTSVTITNLAPSTQYSVMVYEFNITTSFGLDYYYYLTSVNSSNLEAAYTLCTQPTTNTNITSITSINYTSATVNFLQGSGSYSLLMLDDLTNGSNTYYPVDGSAYTVSSVVTSAPLLHNNYMVYNSTGTSVGLTALKSATSYRIRGFSFCGSGTGATWNYMTSSYDYLDFTTLNYQPTLNTLSNVTVCENSGAHTVNLSGISDGSTGETQTVTITATSSNQTLIPNANISVTYDGTSATGTLNYTSATNQYGTATITVTANDGFSSNNTIVRTFTVTVNPFPSAAGTISPATTTFCKNGTNIVFSVPAITNATAYTWSFPSGTVVVSGGTTNSVTVNFPASMSQSSGTITVYGTNTFGCGNGTSSSKSINFDAAPTVSTAGSDVTICNGTTQLQGAQPLIGTGLWSILSGSASFNNSSQYNTNVTGIANGQSVTLQWAISNGVCPTSTDQVIVTYNSAAPQCQIFADFFASNTTPCSGATVNFTDNSVGATGWTWNFGPNATPTTSNLQNPNVVFNSSGVQTITLTVTGPNGTDSETKTNYIDVSATPGAASAISGLTTVCAGEQQVNYSISSVPFADTYIWTLPSGAVINSGNGTEAITINFDPTATSGTITVAGSNACGTGASSNVSITVNPLPDDASGISGDNQVCQGENGVAYSITALNNTTTYNWTLPSGATIATGNNTESITVDYSVLASSGTIMIYGSNACGDGGARTLNVTVDPLPLSADVITGQQLISNCPASVGITYSVPTILNATSHDWILPAGANITSGTGTNSITVDFAHGASSGNVSVNGSNACGVGASSSLAIVVDAVLTQEICLVTVNDSSNRNIVVWEKSLNPLIRQYNIYRDIAGPGYTLIDSVHVDSLSQYEDYSVGVDPNVTQYRYEVSVVDTCGNEGPLSSHHQTIYIFPPLASGNDIILDWDQYEGAGSGFYYRILRDTSSSGSWEAIDSVAAPTTVYTDLNGMLEGTSIRYLIEIVSPDVCVATRATNHNTTRSNRTQAIAGSSSVAEYLDATSVQVFPNPANEMVTLQINQFMYNQAFLIEVLDINGKVVYSTSANSNRVTLDVSNFAKGIYQLRVSGLGSNVVKKLVVN